MRNLSSAAGRRSRCASGPALARRRGRGLAELLCDHVIDREDDRTEEIRAQIQADLLRLAE
jgi:hypothetical protein